MLSYRHGFHAGNFADVLKHAVLVQVLEYMCAKDKGFSYIDTHAGAGMYQLSSEFSQKTAEYTEGIAKLWQRTDSPEGLGRYLELIKSINTDPQLKVYPGSPGVAQQILRSQDMAFLYDLHPADHQQLSDLFAERRKVQVFRRDGYQGLKAHLPPATRRAVVLIDPPYELKTDYRDAVDAVIQGYKLFNSASFILWYPVVQRGRINSMQLQLQKSELRNVLQVELLRSADNDLYGMTGTGLFIVNPPWTLTKELEQIMPYLQQHLAEPSGGFVINQLIAE